ncbi:unnamed protein product [Microthlaspi erraticum]|uniref:Uncharacterized protein n=1 Tax=Microthlaspi erraticum TaxID=1685480 RepID=A0A6D2IA17_9BRAS|nr:unnamed protein product [Microthlaspi erraticum]
MFRRIIYGVLQMQAPLSLLDEMYSFVLSLSQGQALWQEYIKREDEKKKKMKQRQSSTSRDRSTSAPAQSLHQRASSVDLGSVRFPTPPLNQQLRFRHSRTSSTLSRPSRRVQGLLANLQDATGLTQIVNQSGSASGRMDGHVAELNGAKGLMLSWMRACSG